MFTKLLFSLDALLFTVLATFLFIETPSQWIKITNTTTTTTSNNTIQILSQILGISNAFLILPFLYASVSPAIALPSLLFTSLVYGVISAMLIFQRHHLIPHVWNIAIIFSISLSIIHFLCFSKTILNKAKALETKTAISALHAPLLPATETKTSSSSIKVDSAVTIALGNLADADANEEKQRENRGYGTLQLLKIARPHRHWLYYACGVLLIRLPLSLSVPHWVAETIGCLINKDFAGAQQNILFLCAAGTGDALLDFWCVYLFGIAQQRIIRGLRLNLFQAILRQDISFFDMTKTGEITSRLTTDCAEMANDLTSVFRFTIESLVRIGGIIAYMFVRSWRLGLLALGVIPITSMINRIYAKFMHHNQKKVQTALADANSVATEAIGAVRTVCSFAMEEGEFQRYEARIDTYYSLIVHQYFIQGIYYMVCNTFLINTVVQASILGYGAYLIEHSELKATVLLAFMLYQGQLQEYFQNLFNSFTSLVKSSGAAAKVFDYIDRKPRYRNDRGNNNTVSNDDTNYNATTTTTTSSSSGHVSLCNIHFCYPSRPQTVILRGLSLDVPPGSCVALVGASGSGKSTVFSLIEHFYEAQQGNVMIDGVDVADMVHSELHRVVAMVGQEPELLSGTIESNIMYGSGNMNRNRTRNSNAVNRDDLVERMVIAAKDANAYDFIMNELPDGFQTEVGERGVQLSGGQKQRIAIARCLMQNPKILLLDEATSALDSESEAAVQEALNRAMVGRTTIMIAHRLSTVKNADVIVVLNNGVVVETGNHNELMRKGNDGAYHKLVERQTLLSKVDGK